MLGAQWVADRGYYGVGGSQGFLPPALFICFCKNICDVPLYSPGGPSTWSSPGELCMLHLAPDTLKTKRKARVSLVTQQLLLSDLRLDGHAGR